MVIPTLTNPAQTTWAISALAAAGVIVRPWRLPEFVWALAAAVILVVAGLLPVHAALAGVAKGTDVYLFLTGMMLLAELARKEGLFDWLAAKAAIHARGSATRLFLLVYLVGTLVTVFLSNDATAVVLTPAVAAVARAVCAEKPLPYLLICAFIANAASFVLPISNPANLVIYGSQMPSLLAWLPRFAAPSVLSILATYVMLRWTQRSALRQRIVDRVPVPALSGGGKAAAAAIIATALLLMTASTLDWQLGLPACLAGMVTAAIVLLRRRESPVELVRNIAWGVLPLVAGLFVLVEAMERTGLIEMLAHLLRNAAGGAEVLVSWSAGIVLALTCNLMNNLPAGLIAGTAVQAAHLPPTVNGAVLIGIDLGPNLSVTGSLATILWLSALRREGLRVGAGAFLKLGLLVMPPALLLALLGLFLPELIHGGMRF
ncbi:MAG TPA: arsenic transporter [Rhodopila sp.]|nr:arsenic transporter [Rhodopila sp.]